MADSAASRHLAQRKSADAFRIDQFDAVLDQRVTQIAMVIVGFFQNKTSFL